MKISRSDTRDKYPLSPTKIVKKTFSNSLLLLIILFIIWMFLFFINSNSTDSSVLFRGTITVGVIFLMAFIVLANYFYQKWYFAFYYYNLTDDFIVIKKGPITPTEITIPYERVQDIYLDQDLLDRILGLYDVHLSSATISSGKEAHIDGVPNKVAHDLRNHLLKIIQKKISKHKNTSQI